MVKADDLFKADKRRFHQGPRVMTLNFEAGYMHAVFPHATTRRFLAARAGSIYDPLFPNKSEYDSGRMNRSHSLSQTKLEFGAVKVLSSVVDAGFARPINLESSRRAPHPSRFFEG